MSDTSLRTQVYDSLRQALTTALQARDAAAARREIDNDIDRALSYIADLADDAGNIAPAAPKIGIGRRGASAPAFLQLDHV